MKWYSISNCKCNTCNQPFLEGTQIVQMGFNEEASRFCHFCVELFGSFENREARLIIRDFHHQRLAIIRARDKGEEKPS